MTRYLATGRLMLTAIVAVCALGAANARAETPEEQFSRCLNVPGAMFIYDMVLYIENVAQDDSMKPGFFGALSTRCDAVAPAIKKWWDGAFDHCRGDLDRAVADYEARVGSVSDANGRLKDEAKTAILEASRPCRYDYISANLPQIRRDLGI